jgi:hypothetical protein
MLITFYSTLASNQTRLNPNLLTGFLYGEGGVIQRGFSFKR